MIGINEIFLSRRDLLENRRIPNRDIREIKISRRAVAIRDVHDAVITQSHVRRQTCIAQCERHVVPATKMFVDQGLKVDVGQDVAAVSQEWPAAEIAFHILDSAARLKQIRLVNQRNRTTFILIIVKERL